MDFDDFLDLAGAVILAVVLMVLLATFTALFPAWIMMIILGILHADNGWSCNLGFWTCWGILAIVSIVGRAFNFSLNGDD